MSQRERQQQRNLCTHSHHPEMAEEMAPIHPSVRSLLGSSEEEVLKITEEVYHGEYELAPNELPGQQQEEYMAELHAKLSWHLTRAGLRDVPVAAGPTSSSRRHTPAQSLGLSLHWLRLEEEKWPSGYVKVLLTGDPDPRVSAPSLGAGGIDTGVSHSSIRVPCHERHILAGTPHHPQALCTHMPADEQLNCSLSELHLHSQ